MGTKDQYHEVSILQVQSHHPIILKENVLEKMNPLDFKAQTDQPSIEFSQVGYQLEAFVHLPHQEDTAEKSLGMK